jgi:glycosyltransferase involved in cell wall biosynthesis
MSRTDVPQVLLVPGANPAASFVEIDRRILSGLAELRELLPGFGPIDRFAFAWRLRRALSTAPGTLVVLWFATPGYGSITAAACRWAGAPYLVVAGGAEVANQPDARFGDARRPCRRVLVSRVLAGARVVWAFSDSARQEIEALARPSRLRVVPPAVDTSFYGPIGLERERQALTACVAITRVSIRQKGLDRVVDLARTRPQVPFVIAGAADVGDAAVRTFIDASPPNVTFAGFVSREALRDLYARSRVYLQLSAHEGFGVAVAESLAMGCTPLVSDLASMRALVHDAALRVARAEPIEETVFKLDRALDRSYPAPKWADIDRTFGIDARRTAWLRELAELGFRTHAEE